jgi:hypothetical protein
MIMIVSKEFYIIIFTVIVVTWFGIYGSLHFYRDPCSIFFDPSRALERHYSLQREQEAISFRNAAFFAIKEQNAISPDPIWKAGQSQKICGIFITVKRDTGKSKNPLEVCSRGLPIGVIALMGL